MDGGTAQHGIAELAQWVPLTFAGGASNGVDAATARVLEDIEIDHTIPQSGRISGVGDIVTRLADEDDVRVRKLGRTTGWTEGRATAFDIDVLVYYDGNGQALFANQIEFEGLDSPFSKAGDSGSVILDREDYAVALLFSGNPSAGQSGRGITYGNPFAEVVNALGVTLMG